MPAPRTILSQRALNEIKDMVQNLTNDTSINTTVRYRRFDNPSSFDPEAQVVPSVYTSFSGVSALKGHFSDREIAFAGGEIEEGDVKFLIVQSAISGIPRTVDVVVESGVSYNIHRVWTDPWAISYILQAREL